MPSADTPQQAPAPPSADQLPVSGWGRVKKFFSSMSLPVALALFGLAALEAVCLALLPGAIQERGPAVISHGLTITAELSLLAFLVILHGHGTGCPSCQRWWAKRDTGKELIDSAVHYKDDSSSSARDGKNGYESDEGRRVFKVLTYHHKHRCAYCGHQWAIPYVDRYESTVRRRQLQEPANEPKPSKRYTVE